jgi:Mn2+/Fe2+ NRAMP family transporter
LVNTSNGVGIAELDAAGFPAALAATAGPAVGTVFALGLIEAGALAILTISASTAYAAGECIGVSHSFNSSPRRAVLFYTANIATALIGAAIILIPGAPLLAIALNANVLATALLPMALIFMLMLANDRDLMGRRVNTRATNTLAVSVIAFVAVSGAAYGIFSFLQAVHLIPASSN